ncbi:MAG: hypothetical protein V1784_09460 [bacterium]
MSQRGLLLNVEADTAQEAVDGAFRYAVEERQRPDGADRVDVKCFGDHKPDFGVILDKNGKELEGVKA